MSSEESVGKFLRAFKEKMSIWDVLFRDDRGKNLQTLTVLEISPSARKAVLEKLTPQDYAQGPLEENLYGLREMWVFGKRHKGTEIYIKITMGFPGTSVICISFHQAEYPIQYPFKTKRT